MLGQEVVKLFLWDVDITSPLNDLFTRWELLCISTIVIFKTFEEFIYVTHFKDNEVASKKV